MAIDSKMEVKAEPDVPKVMHLDLYILVPNPYNTNSLLFPLVGGSNRKLWTKPSITSIVYGTLKF